MNLQGDVIAILNTSGTKVVEYTYNAWGKVLSVTGSLANTIGKINPFRYRGYYYDTETGFYHLQSRYYDPEVGRFLNADEPITQFLSQYGLTFTNQYTYCVNNPIINRDLYGDLPTIGAIIAGALIGGVLGALLDAVSQMIIYNRSFSQLDWGSIIIEFASGALTGALIACNLPAPATNLGRGIIGMMSSLAHSIKNGKFSSLKGAFQSIGTAILSGAATVIWGQYRAKRGKTLTYETIVQMIKNIGINRAIRGGIRFTVRILWFKIDFTIN